MTSSVSEEFHEGHPNALAIYCSDGRFTRAVEALVSELGHERLDTMTLPGGPALLCTAGANLSEVDTVVRAAHFLIEGHRIVQVVLVAHQGCGYYRNRYPRLAAAQLEEHQREHLAVAARALRRRHPELTVQCYFARVSDDGRIVFEERTAAAK